MGQELVFGTAKTLPSIHLGSNPEPELIGILLAQDILQGQAQFLYGRIPLLGIIRRRHLTEGSHLRMTGQAPGNIVQDNGEAPVTVAGIRMQFFPDQFRSETKGTILFPVDKIQLGKDADGFRVADIEFRFFHGPVQIHIGLLFHGIKAGDPGMAAKQTNHGKVIGKQDFLFVRSLFVRKIRIKKILRNLSQPDAFHVIRPQHRVTTPEGVQCSEMNHFGL